jgi:hypothetical protein
VPREAGCDLLEIVGKKWGRKGGSATGVFACAGAEFRFNAAHWTKVVLMPQHSRTRARRGSSRNPSIAAPAPGQVGGEPPGTSSRKTAGRLL